MAFSHWWKLDGLNITYLRLRLYHAMSSLYLRRPVNGLLKCCRYGSYKTSTLINIQKLSTRLTKVISASQPTRGLLPIIKHSLQLQFTLSKMENHLIWFLMSWKWQKYTPYSDIVTWRLTDHLKSHNGVNLAAVFAKILDDFGISDKVCIVRK